MAARQFLLIDDRDFSEELAAAARLATAAHRVLRATPLTAGNYQQVSTPIWRRRSST